MRESIVLKIGRPGIFADRFSINSSMTFIFSRLASSRSSASWASIERICLSSTSVDFLAYKKYLDMVVLYHNGWCKAQRRSILRIMNEAERLGKNLKRIRTEKGISQGEIGRILEVDKGFISNIEAGKTNPTLATIAKLAKAVGVSTGELMK